MAAIFGSVAGSALYGMAQRIRPGQVVMVDGPPSAVATGVKVGLTMPSPPEPAWLKHYIETGETP